MIRRFAHLVARIAAAFAVVAVVVVPIVVMARVAGNPFDPATLERLADRRVDDGTIVKLLSVAFYAIWAWVALPASAQARLHLTTRRSTARRRATRSTATPPPADRPGPRSWLARLVRFALTTTVVSTITTTSTLVFADATTSPSQSLVAPTPAATLPIEHVERPTEHRPELVTDIAAQRRDTPYAVAVRLFPDRVEAARDEIVALNQGRPTPDGHTWRGGSFPEGMNVVVPAHTPEPDDTGVGSESDVDGHEWPTHLPAATIVVEPGDNVWNLTEARLDSVDGPDNQPSDATILEQVDDVIAANSFASGDPDLIYPGETLDFPAIGTPPTNGDEPAVDQPIDMPDNGSEDQLDATPETEGTTPPSPVLDVVESDEIAPTTQPEVVPIPQEVDAFPPPTAAAAEPVVSATPPVEADGPDTETGGVEPGHIAGLAGAIVLSSALASALVLARRRGRTRSVGSGGRAPVSEIERAIVAAADIPFVRWASQELAALARSIDPEEHLAVPVVVELDDEEGIEVLWDQPMAVAPPPWEATDGGWSWRTLYDPDEPTPLADWPSPMPSLVTVGSRAGRQVLLDLEHVGALAVTGDGERVDALLRSIVFELGTGDDLADALVYAVGVDCDAPEGACRVRTATVDESIDAVRAALGEARTLVGDFDTLFHQRLGVEPLLGARPTVVVVGGGVDSDEHVRIADSIIAGRGVAAVVRSVGADTSVHLHIDEDGSALLTGIAEKPLHLAAAGIPATTADAVMAALSESSTEDTTDADDEPGSSKVDPPPGADDTDLVRLPADERSDIDAEIAEFEASLQADVDDWHEPDPIVMVRVLGQPAVDDLPEVRGLTLRLLVYLACQSGPVSLNRIRNAVWGGAARDRKTISNKLSELRAALGTADDGEPLVTAATADGVTLHDGVMTDLSIFESLAARADEVSSHEAIDLLRRALSLVEGPAFDDAGYEWAVLDHPVHDRILSAASRLFELACDADDLATARLALVHGMKGVPGNEELYRLRMQLEHRCIGPAGVHDAFKELTSQLESLDCDPSDETLAVYCELTGRSSQA